MTLTTHPARLRAWRGFFLFGQELSSRISGNDLIADSRCIKSKAEMRDKRLGQTAFREGRDPWLSQ
jgi:hypothetical protein